MDGQLLDPEQIVPAGETSRHFVRVVAPQRPGRAAAAESWAFLCNLEPVAVTSVRRGGAGGLGHVHRDGTLVVHGRVEGPGEAVPCLDGGGGRAGAAGADVAAQVVGGEVCHGRVVVCVFADVLEDGVVVELLETVVGSSRRGGKDRHGETGDRLHGVVAGRGSRKIKSTIRTGMKCTVVPSHLNSIVEALVNYSHSTELPRWVVLIIQHLMYVGNQIPGAQRSAARIPAVTLINASGTL